MFDCESRLNFSYSISSTHSVLARRLQKSSQSIHKFFALLNGANASDYSSDLVGLFFNSDLVTVVGHGRPSRGLEWSLGDCLE